MTGPLDTLYDAEVQVTALVDRLRQLQQVVDMHQDRSATLAEARDALVRAGDNVTELAQATTELVVATLEIDTGAVLQRLDTVQGTLQQLRIAYETDLTVLRQQMSETSDLAREVKNGQLDTARSSGEALQSAREAIVSTFIARAASQDTAISKAVTSLEGDMQNMLGAYESRSQELSETQQAILDQLNPVRAALDAHEQRLDRISLYAVAAMVFSALAAIGSLFL